MPAKAGIQVRHSAHDREEAMVRTMRRPTPRRRAVADTYAHIPTVVPVKTGTSHPPPSPVMPAFAGMTGEGGGGMRHSAHGAEAPVDRAPVRGVGAVREPPEAPRHP